ncbi:conserved hypothetical protein [Beggiatoa sp. SS]|nr:conserved hypothetical protein [Beggiatoa sp. SS]
MRQLFRGPGEGLGLIELPAHLQLEVEDYRLHPVLLDVCLRVGGIIEMETEEPPYLPFMVETIKLFDKQAYSRLWSYVSKVAEGAKETPFLKMNIRLFSETGQAVAELLGLTLRPASREAMTGSTLRTDWLYQLAWQPANLPPQSPYEEEAGRWLIVSGKAEQADGLAQQLQLKGGISSEHRTLIASKVSVSSGWNSAEFTTNIPLTWGCHSLSFFIWLNICQLYPISIGVSTSCTLVSEASDKTSACCRTTFCKVYGSSSYISRPALKAISK